MSLRMRFDYTVDYMTGEQFFRETGFSAVSVSETKCSKPDIFACRKPVYKKFLAK